MELRDAPAAQNLCNPGKRHYRKQGAATRRVLPVDGHATRQVGVDRVAGCRLLMLGAANGFNAHAVHGGLDALTSETGSGW